MTATNIIAMVPTDIKVVKRRHTWLRTEIEIRQVYT